MNVDAIAALLRQCGFDARVWRESRIYISGYGRALKIAIQPCDPAARPLDGAVINVTSTWRSNRNGLFCKGAKHALLQDLYRARLISAAPPEDWRRVILDDRPIVRPRVTPLDEFGD